MNNSLEFLCPFCNESHEIQILNKPTQALINGMAVQYEETTYYCEKEQEFFVPKVILKNNLLAARDAYRMQNGLLTSKEIKDARNQYGLTQKEFALLLGWGEVTIQRYETKLIQDETFDQKIRNVKDNPKLALEELEKHKDKFGDTTRYNEIKKLISSLIKTKSISYLNKQIIESYYIDFREKSELNGFKELDLEKLTAMISFFAMKSSKLYKVKLMKLLWYSDMLFFKKNKHSMSGLVYEHFPFGAVPIAHEEILKYASKCIEIISEEFDNGAIGYKILPKECFNLRLESEETEILTKVIERFGNFGSKEISDYMHEEVAYKQTSANEIISYVFAEEITGFNIN